MYIFDLQEKRFYAFGRATGAQFDLFDLARVSARCEERFEDFLRIFTEEEQWDDVDRVGARTLYDAMLKQPEARFELHTDHSDMPHGVGETRYWPCFGSIWSPDALDMFDYCGYLHIAEADVPAWEGWSKKHGRGGSIKVPELAELQHYVKLRKWVVPGLPA
jgi:hypothetical protein